MRKIYVILMKTNTIPCRIVEMFTRYEYGHVAISLNKDCITTYSFGRRKLNSILNGGFVVNEKHGAFFTKFHKTTCSVYEVEITAKQYKDLTKILSEMEKEQHKYKYDFLGLFLRLFGFRATFKNKYVCSYFVADVLKKAGICEFEKDVCFVKPKDFENIPNFKKIYTGSYKLYST